MIRFIVQRLASLIATIFCVITLTFLLMKAIPGDPFNDEKALTKEIHQSLLTHYGLDAPLSTQYYRYLKSIAIGDLGPSLKYSGRTVNQLIREGFPISCLLGLEALIIATAVGLLLGTLSATYSKNIALNIFTKFFVMIGVSLPNFACAAFLQYLLAVKWPLFPIGRWGTWEHSFLPACSLAILPAAFITRLVKGQVEKVFQQDFVKVCKAKGLTDFQIMTKHVLKNSLHPLLAYLGQVSANILAGSFIIEKSFSIPGLGQWFVKSVMNRDYPVIMGLTVFYSIILLSMVLIFDLLSLWIDPRIRSTTTSDKNKLHKTLLHV